MAESSTPSRHADPHPVRRIIVCADDFAVTQSASMGIAKLARLGRISAASAMVLSPRWTQDAALLQDMRDQLDVGLHLDWTSSFARAAGHGMSLYSAMRQAVLGRLGGRAAAEVIARQLDLFEAHWRSPPDYVDGHQHVQQFAGIREALVAELTHRYGRQTVKPYLRVSRASPTLTDLKSRVITWMGANALEKIATDAGFTVARSLYGIYNFDGNTAHYAALMTSWLTRASTGAILMCHPAQAAEPGDEIGVARAQEFAYLIGPEFTQTLQQTGVLLARGQEVLHLNR